MKRALASLLLLGAVAHAQDADTKAQADALFDEGRTLLAKGDFAHACEDFETSNSLVPKLGVQLNIADCHEKLGKTATAWVEWRDGAAAAQKAGDSARADLAKQKAAALESRLDKLVITATPGVKDPITRDGKPVLPVLLGKAVPVDPGEHTVVAGAFSQKVVVDGEGKTFTVNVEAGPTAGPPEPPHPVPPPIQAPTEAHQPRTGSGQRIAGIAVGAAGVVAIGVSLGLGSSAKSVWNDGAGCSNGFCSAEAVDHWHTAQARAATANVVFGVGVAAVAAGVVVYLLAPHPHAASVAAAPTTGGGVVVLGGSF